ncbi:MAG: DUF3352 domain-containing protein [Chloroflexota bacterium]|nr:DUF3352 domain-containing protein [Chloroflexota bacterium]
MGAAFRRFGGSRPDTARRARDRGWFSAALVALLGALLAGPALGAAPAAAQEAEGPSTVAVAPEETLVYAAVNLDDRSDQWRLADDLLSRLGLDEQIEQALAEDAEMAIGVDFLRDNLLGGELGIVVTEQLFDAIAETGAAGAIDPAAVGASPVASPVAAALPDSFGVAGILDTRDPDAALSLIESSLEDQANEAGTAVEETDYEGVTIRSAASDDLGGAAVSVARVDDHILLSAAPNDLEPLIDVAQGNGSSLADAGGYGQVRAALDEDFLLYSYQNGEAARAAQERLGDLVGAAGPLTDLQRGAAHTGTLIRADDPGFRLETVAIPFEGEPFPTTEAFDAELAAQTPGDALFFLNGADLGPNGTLDALGALLIAAATGGLAGDPAAIATPAPNQTAEEYIAAQYEQLAGLIGFNLQTDLLQQLVGEYALWVSSDEDPSSITVLFASGVEDPGTVVNALSQINNLIQAGGGGAINVTTRQVAGASVNVIDTGDPALPDLEYGVVDGRLLIAFNDAIDDFVAGADESLADDEQFQEVFGELPDQTTGSLFVDLGQIVPLLQAAAEASAAEGGDELVDAAEACADYDSQEEAQEAYDAGEEGTFDLDQDFDGEACEDFFAAATPAAEATPIAEEVAEIDLSALTSFALVAYDEDGNRRASGLLAIADDGGEATPVATPVP